MRFAELFRLVAPRAKAYLIHRGVAPLAAEALAIEAMIEVWRTARGFDVAAQSGQAWIFGVLRDISRRHGVSLQMTRQ
ncbi:hypothetical protein [Phenylobacterium sp.]|uniref:hypothetical protein n=1 Tax=Phenylobacterium sp. TaxID=1871053 RepID=UPI001207F32F|nr:hypothetical protein [Phenylobacterium sp.]THD63874.1 MAG: hypothetical protein E8A49_04145 [Phenylobacterium sp.]